MEISEELSEVEKLFSDILIIFKKIYFNSFLFLFAVSLDFYMLSAIV